MTLYVQTTDSAGRPVAINPDLVVGVEPAPNTVPASCFVRTSSSENYVLPGTVASVTALLASAGADVLAQAKAYTDAAIAALVFPFAMGMAGTGTAATVITRYVSLSSTNETAFILGSRLLVGIVIEMSQNNITVPITFTLLKNGVDQAGPVVFAGGETGPKTIDGLALLSTDRVSVRYDYTGGTAGTTWAGGVTFNVKA